MKTRIQSAMIAALVLLGPAVGVAEEKPWQALRTVAATPMDSEEMSVVTGKATMSLFDWAKTYGTMSQYGGGTVYIWTSSSLTTTSVK